MNPWVLVCLIIFFVQLSWIGLRLSDLVFRLNYMGWDLRRMKDDVAWIKDHVVSTADDGDVVENYDD